jgi:hypothetical protein
LKKAKKLNQTVPGVQHIDQVAILLEAVMPAEPTEMKRKLSRSVAVMFFVSFLLTAFGVLEFIHDGRLSRFAFYEIIFGVGGIIVTVAAWLLTVFL